ncbi:uncharacterized protein [Montipora foliosa]|uniref:uncharacterized protein n=1 Tax=Montipora foliosa TaxID=591990 RepID=UPI0035F1872F
MDQDGQLEQLIKSIKSFKIGTFEKFGDALPGEIEGLRLNVALFGMTGSGKSALINTIFECLGFEAPAMTQATSCEGTRVLDCFPVPGSHVTFYDTAGFFHLGKIEEGELFRIIYGLEKPGDDLTRDAASAWKAAKGGLAAHRYEKPPIADQVHVVIWVISATDVRFEQGKYRENIDFVQHILKREIITIITVLTHDDEIQKRENPEAERKRLREAAMEVTGSDRRNVYFVVNSFGDPKDYSPVYKKCVMQVVEEALKCGERSVKMRQVYREGSKTTARKMRETKPQARKFKKPQENTFKE